MPHKLNADANTLAWYEEHATSFLQRTHHLKLEGLYTPFLQSLPEGATVMDLGCGSGRDAKYFLKQGLTVLAVDPCQAFVNPLRTQGIPCIQGDVSSLTPNAHFDGIWANASLLHYSRHTLPRVMVHLLKCLRPNGILFASFKSGNFEGQRAGRFFCDWTPAQLRTQLAHLPEFEALKIWESQSVKAPSEENWVNLLARRAVSSKSIEIRFDSPTPHEKPA